MLGTPANMNALVRAQNCSASGLIILVRSLLNPFEDDNTKQETEKALVSLTRLNEIVIELRRLKKKIAELEDYFD